MWFQSTLWATEYLSYIIPTRYDSGNERNREQNVLCSGWLFTFVVRRTNEHWMGPILIEEHRRFTLEIRKSSSSKEQASSSLRVDGIYENNPFINPFLDLFWLVHLSSHKKIGLLLRLTLLFLKSSQVNPNNSRRCGIELLAVQNKYSRWLGSIFKNGSCNWLLNALGGRLNSVLWHKLGPQAQKG